MCWPSTDARRNCIAHPTVMARRAALVAAGGYRAAFLAAEDYDLWLRLSETADLANLPGVSRNDTIHSLGAPGFIVNEVNLTLNAAVGDNALVATPLADVGLGMKSEMLLWSTRISRS